jgi:uncharacterized surface protein with fasciclin (FAS1) repeats
MLWSCTESPLGPNNEPDWMSNSIYETLKGNKHHTSTYVKMLQRMDSSYIEILNKTGSRTLFVPNDEAFTTFFQNNPYGYRSVDDMPTSLVSEFLKFYTLENAYVSSVLGSSENYISGDCIRRFTTFNTSDTIPYVDNFPENAQFDKFRGGKMYLISPGRWTLVNFTQSFFNAKAFKSEDFSAIYPDRTWNNGDVYIFDAKVIEKDITNKNGYIHILDKVVLPPKNMYETIRDNENTTIFRKLMERFCGPVYNAEATKALWDRNPSVRDSVYDISFFYTGDRTITDEYGNQIKVDNLFFSPAINGAQSITGVASVGDPPRNMPVIFVPTDDAMISYLQTSMLRDYGTWDNVPDNIASKFVKTHFKKLFTDVFPTRLATAVEDDKGDPMFKNFNYSQDIAGTTMCRNGLIYTINKVVVPRDFATVVAPIMTDPRTTIVNWIVNAEINNEVDYSAPRYNYFLSSMVNTYTFIVPVDAAFEQYKDPYNQANDIAIKKWMKFRYYPTRKVVSYRFNDINGDSIPPAVTMPSGSNATMKVVQNRLRDIMDYHIVLGEIENDQAYVTTKGGTHIKIDRSAGQMRFQGAGDIENGSYVNILDQFETNNGTVYIVDKTIEHTLNSQFNQISTSTANTLFSQLMSEYNDPDVTFWGDSVLKYFNSTVVVTQKLPEYKAPIFQSKVANKDMGIDWDIPFLGAFDYSIFVPTDAAIQEAYNDGLIMRTNDIKVMTNRAAKIEEIKKVIRFIKYHFVDKSLFTEKFYNSENSSGYQFPNIFTTSAKSITNRMLFKVNIDQQGSQFVLTDNFGRVARTLSGDNGVMTRQYRFSNSNTHGLIDSSSRAVIYRIDKALKVE